MTTYLETVGKDIDQKRATFSDIAAAQMKAWGEAAEKLESAATKLGTENRAKADRAFEQMRAQATESRKAQAGWRRVMVCAERSPANVTQ